MNLIICELHLDNMNQVRKQYKDLEGDLLFFSTSLYVAPKGIYLLSFTLQIWHLKTLFNPTCTGLWTTQICTSMPFLTICWMCQFPAKNWSSKFDWSAGPSRLFLHWRWCYWLGTCPISKHFIFTSTHAWTSPVMSPLLCACFCRTRNAVQNLWTNSTSKSSLGLIFQNIMLFVELWSDLLCQLFLCFK
jgi:hypothetical protein